MSIDAFCPGPVTTELALAIMKSPTPVLHTVIVSRGLWNALMVENNMLPALQKHIKPETTSAYLGSVRIEVTQ